MSIIPKGARFLESVSYKEDHYGGVSWSFLFECAGITYEAYFSSTRSHGGRSIKEISPPPTEEVEKFLESLLSSSWPFFLKEGRFFEEVVVDLLDGRVVSFQEYLACRQAQA